MITNNDITKTWIGRDGYPRVKFAEIGKPLIVRKLLQNGDANTKTRKNAKRGFETRALSLSPSTESGFGNTCPSASRGCAAACLDHQGLASVFARIRLARMAKTACWFKHREWFLDTVRRELRNAVAYSARKGADLAVRLNVFSDLAWERCGIMDEFPSINFYDYTKHVKRAGLVRTNYWVTFSRSETNESDCLNVLGSGNNVAIVFADNGKFVGNRSANQDLPTSWLGYPVINGDDTDLRFEDKRGYWVGLRLKAHSHAERISAINSGFAVEWRQ